MKSIKKLMHFNSSKVKDKHTSNGNGSQGSPDSKYGSEASKEMQELRELRKQYEGLFEVSNMVSARALDFSSSMQQLATYLINTFGSIEDGETGKVFKIVGRVQSEMSKILELYAAQVLQTLTEPTETLLSELQNVEDSRRQHDEKRQLYEQLRARIVKGRPKNGKAEAFADQQLQVVKDEFDKLSMFVNARLVSLEQGRPRSLITQAARHHTAQMHLFSRGHAALQAVEPYMRQVARERNIDREISLTRHGLNDKDFENDSNDDDDVSYMDELDTSDSSLEHSSGWISRTNSPERSPDILDEGMGVPKNLTKEWNSMLLRSSRSLGENSQARQSGEYSHVRSNSGDVPDFREGSIYGSGPATPRLDGSAFGSGATTPRLVEQSRCSSYSPGYHSSKSAPLTARGLPVDGDDNISPMDDRFRPREARDEDVESNEGDVYNSPPARPPPVVPSVRTRGMDGVGFSTTSSEYTSHSVSTSARTSLDNHYHTSDPDLSASGMQSDSSGVSSKYSQKSVGLNSESIPAKSPSSSDQKLPSPKLQTPVSLVEKPPVVNFVSPALSSTPLGFTSNTMDSRRRDLKRYSQSGPLTFNGMPWSSQPSLGNMGPNTSSQSGVNSASELHRSGPLGRSPLGRTFGSPRISPCISPPRMSPPRISELHKLPPPPLDQINNTSTPLRSSDVIAHSAPLSRPERTISPSSVRATPLPPPPLGSMPRSLSMPARQKNQQYQQRSKPPTIPQVLEVSDEESASPSHEQSEKNNTGGGGSFSSQERAYLPRASSPTRNFSVQEVGLLPANLKFIHVDASGSASGTSTPRSQLHMRPPSPSALTRVSADSQPHTPSLKSASPRTSRWRSLSISDTDSYLQNAAKGTVFKREFSPELVTLGRR